MIADIHNAEEIYGSDVGSLKGKTTRHKLKAIINYIEIPKTLVQQPMKSQSLHGRNASEWNLVPHHDIQAHQVSDSSTIGYSDKQVLQEWHPSRDQDLHQGAFLVNEIQCDNGF